MRINKFYSLFFLFSSMLSQQLNAASDHASSRHEHRSHSGKNSNKITDTHSRSEALLIEKVKLCIKSKDYSRLGLVLRDSVGYYVTLQKIKQVAKSEGFAPLLRAVNTSETILKLNFELGLSPAELVQISLYIETTLPKQIRRNKNYLLIEETGLACDIEYDPVTKYRFIHLGKNNTRRIGQGAHKIVTKSIVYDKKSPEILARCRQSRVLDHELEITNKVQGLKGVVETRAYTTHQENDITYHTLFCKLYSPGSISRVFKDLPEYKFNLKEKMSIALNILKGLEGLQAQNIIHKDLGAENYLINISKKRKNGCRDIDAVISDLGCSIYTWEANGVKVQGHSAYTSPEGIFISRMQGTDYFKSDLFAVGCMFYRIFYEKKPAWVDSEFIKGTESEEVRYQNHVAAILGATQTRKAFLDEKLMLGISLSVREQFESLILQMIDVDPLKRGTAAEHRKEIERLIKLVHK